jgi:hypothetical protein
MDLDPLFLRNGLITFILLVGSVVLHEWAHAMAAHLLGDDTPRAEGRVTLLRRLGGGDHPHERGSGGVQPAADPAA